MNLLRIKKLEKRVDKLEKKQCCITPKGPYTDDAAAEAAGVQIGELYYNDTGDARVRIV